MAELADNFEKVSLGSPEEQTKLEDHNEPTTEEKNNTATATDDSEQKENKQQKPTEKTSEALSKETETQVQKSESSSKTSNSNDSNNNSVNNVQNNNNASVETAKLALPSWGWYTRASEVTTWFSKTKNPPVSMKGKTVLVTGGTIGGVGFEVARALAEMGAQVIITVRSQEKGDAAVKLINSNAPVPATWIFLELGQLASVRKMAAEFKKRHSKLDILVLNAGVYQTPQFHLTADGFEEQLQVNFLGHYLLFQELREILAKDSRVISVASDNHNFANLCLNDFEFHGKNTTYWNYWAHCRSKLAMCTFTIEAQKRYQKDNISFFACHPGSIRSNYYKRIEESSLVKVWKWMDDKFLLWKTPEQGAATIVLLAIHPSLKTGSYWYDCLFQSFARKAFSEGEALFSKCDELVKEK